MYIYKNSNNSTRSLIVFRENLCLPKYCNEHLFEIAIFDCDRWYLYIQKNFTLLSLINVIHANFQSRVTNLMRSKEILENFLEVRSFFRKYPCFKKFCHEHLNCVYLCIKKYMSLCVTDIKGNSRDFIKIFGRFLQVLGKSHNFQSGVWNLNRLEEIQGNSRRSGEFSIIILLGVQYLIVNCVYFYIQKYSMPLCLTYVLENPGNFREVLSRV